MEHMRLRITVAIVASALLAASPIAGAAEFERVKTKTFDKRKFVFPDDVGGGRLTVLFLAMSTDQDNGIYQQEALLEWHAALDERGVFSDEVVPYHFAVLAGPPFFIKGMIRSGMRDFYDGKIALDRAGVLFVDDLAAFAAAAGLEADARPTIVIATADAAPLQAFKGDVSPDGADEIAGAIRDLLTERE
jgi:hypothetical protein